jgi:hypothetical protein
MKRPFGFMALAALGLLAAGAVAVANQDLRPGTAEAASEPSDVLKRVPPGVPGPPPSFDHRIDPQEMAERRDEFYADLAEELGKSPDAVEQAFMAVFEKGLDEAVDEGRLTRERADRMLEAREAGVPFGPMVRMRLRGDGPGVGAPPPPPPLP